MGSSLHYVEGWHVVAEANRIFGFDGWDRESVTSTCVWTKQTGLRFAAAYVTRVRITVRAGDERIVREGCGAGESNAASPGQAHEFAAKAAETDATKRALSTFGNSFGLSLYAGPSDPNGRKSFGSVAARAASQGAGPEAPQSRRKWLGRAIGRGASIRTSGTRHPTWMAQSAPELWNGDRLIRASWPFRSSNVCATRITCDMSPPIRV